MQLIPKYSYYYRVSNGVCHFSAEVNFGLSHYKLGNGGWWFGGVNTEYFGHEGLEGLSVTFVTY